MGTRLFPFKIPVVTFIDSIPGLNYFDAEDFLRSTSDVKQTITLLVAKKKKKSLTTF